MSRDEILSLATDVRAFLEPVWQDWHRAWGGDQPAIPSESTCGRSSLFLQRALIHVGIAAEWVSGVPAPNSVGQKIGFFDGSYRRSHAWVECQGFVVDVTADQFGAAPVTVCPFDADRYRKGTGDAALPEFASARASAVAAIWPVWIAGRGQVSLQPWPMAL